VTSRRPRAPGRHRVDLARVPPGRGAAASAVALAATAALVLLPGTAAADVTVAAPRAEPDMSLPYPTRSHAWEAKRNRPGVGEVACTTPPPFPVMTVGRNQLQPEVLTRLLRK
jgi:hypothetical protein